MRALVRRGLERVLTGALALEELSAGDSFVGSLNETPPHSLKKT